VRICNTQTGKYRHTHCSVLLLRHALACLVGTKGITGFTCLGETRSVCAPLNMQVVDLLLLLLLLTPVHQNLTLSRSRNCRRVELCWFRPAACCLTPIVPLPRAPQ
jgi:hypothetical protein